MTKNLIDAFRRSIDEDVEDTLHTTQRQLFKHMLLEKDQ